MIRNDSPTKDLLLLLAVMVLLVAGNCSSPIHAQDDDDLSSLALVDESSVFVPAPRELLRPLLRAEKAIKKGETDRAVALLGAVLADPTPEDYLVRKPGKFRLVTSLRTRAIELLGQVPLKDRKTHQLRYGIQAKQLLEQALDKSDVRAMASVMQRFFYTRAGYDAAMIVGHYHLDQGHPSAAASCFRRVHETDEARAIYDPSVSVLLATCWTLAGDDRQAEDVLRNLKQRRPDGFITFQGERRSLFRNDESPVLWLKQLVGNSPLKTNRWVNAWVMFRGNPQRNGTSGSGFPMQSPRWSLPTTNDPRQELLLKESQEAMIQAGSATIPAVQPIAVGNSIVMRAPDRLIGVDFATGKRTWMFPNWDQQTFFRSESLNQAKGFALNKTPLAQRMWKDHLFGQVSSDGQHVFLVPNPGMASNSKMKLDLGAKRLLNDPLNYRIYNELIAVELAREGALKWEVGGETGLDEPKLAKAFFLGPPLPIDNSLLVVAQQGKEIKLLSLDPSSGALQWAQQIASTETGGDVASIAGRRLAGATPSYSDGLVVCPTGVGAIVAVDIATRSLAWGFQYGSAKNKRVAKILVNQTSADSANRTGFLDDGTWRDSTITIADGFVTFTPVDRQELLCLDLLTGQPQWTLDGTPTAAIPREDSLFVASIVDEHAILVGRDFTRSVDLNTGKTRWSLKTVVHGRPSGRGYSDKQFVYQPMTSKKLLKIDVTNGQIVNSVQTSDILGNLIFFQGDIISHAAGKVTAFTCDEANVQRIQKAVAKGQMNAELYSMKGQLESLQGKLREAVASLIEANRLSKSEVLKNQLFDLLIQLTRKDIAAAENLVIPYIDELRQQRPIEFLTAQLEGNINAGRWQQASNATLDFLNSSEKLKSLNSQTILYTEPDRPRVAFDPPAIDTDQRLGVWLKSKIDRILKESNETTRTELTERLNEILERNPSPDVTENLGFVGLIGIQSLSGGNLKRLTSQLIEAKRFASFDKIVRELEPGRPDLAAELKTQFAEELGPQLVSKLESRNSIPPFQWNSGVVTPRRLPTYYDPVLSDYDKTLHRNRFDIIEHDNGDWYTGYQFYYFGSTGELQVTDANGVEVCRIPIRGKRGSFMVINAYMMGQLRIDGQLLIGNIGSMAFAVDWSRYLAGENPLLWSERHISETRVSLNTTFDYNVFNQRILKVKQYQGIGAVQVVRTGNNKLCYFNNERIVCIDEDTGLRNWEKEGIARSARIFGSNGQLLVLNQKRKFVDRFSAEDGSYINRFALPESFGSVWITKGSKLLLADKAAAPEDPSSKVNAETSTVGQSKKIKMIKSLNWFDLETNQSIWSREYSDETDAIVFDSHRRLLVVGDTGEVTILNLEDGQQTHSYQLSLPEDEFRYLTRPSIQEFRDRYVLTIQANTKTSTRLLASNKTYFRMLGYGVFNDGYVLSLDKQTFQPQWEKPIRIRWLKTNESLPWNSPLLLYYRRVDRTSAIASQRYLIQVVAIDIRTGKFVAYSTMPYQYRLEYQVQLEPASQMVEMVAQDFKVSFELTGEAPPPRPLAHLGEQNSMFFSQSIQNPSDNKFTEREKERQALLGRLTKFQQRELEKQREAMRELFEKQKADWPKN